jgi:type IV secretion system protein TrbK
VSPRLLTALVLAGVVAFGAAIIFWTVIQPDATSGPSAATPEPEAVQRAYRERFFGGDPDRDVRGGQEMKPRW